MKFFQTFNALLTLFSEIFVTIKLNLSASELINQKVINFNRKIFNFVTFCHLFNINISEPVMADEWIDQGRNLIVLG